MLIALHVPEKIFRVPSQPSSGRRNRSVIFWDDDWEPGKLVTEKTGKSRNAEVEKLWAWYMRRPGAGLPERPPQDLIDEADAAWEQRKARIRERALSIKCPSCEVPEGPCMRGKGKGKRPTDQIHTTRVIEATRQLDEEDRAKSQTLAGDDARERRSADSSGL